MGYQFNPLTGQLDLVGSPSAGGGAITTQDEGVTLTAATTVLNFTGAGVTATNTAGSVTVNVPAGTGGSGVSKAFAIAMAVAL